jgi:tRNA nucleotidyltransferase/poly(A) polymerase
VRILCFFLKVLLDHLEFGLYISTNNPAFEPFYTVCINIVRRIRKEAVLTEQTANLDTLLKIWAVLGPLLAAAASAIWLRYVQTADREFEHSGEQERAVRERERRYEEHNRQLRVQKYNEVKAGLADFMASSHEYVRKQSEYITTPLPERHQSASSANDKFVYSFQIVTLLGNSAIASNALDLWNATLVVPKSYNLPIDAQYEEKLRVYRNVRAVFNDAARAYLQELETSTPKTALNPDAQ